MRANTELEACQERVALRARAARVGERLRLWVNAVPVLGAPIAVGLAWLHPLLGSVAVAALTLGWVVGIYRTERLCQHTAGRLQDAEHDLSQAKAAAESGRSRGRSLDAPPSAAWARAGVRTQQGKRKDTPLHH